MQKSAECIIFIITPRAEQTAHIHYSFGDIIMNGDKRTWEHTFAFIGAGNMASAFIFGLVDKGGQATRVT